MCVFMCVFSSMELLEAGHNLDRENNQEKGSNPLLQPHNTDPNFPTTPLLFFSLERETQESQIVSIPFSCLVEQ